MANENNGFAKLMRFCATTADFEAAKTDGAVTDDVLVSVLQDKVAKFKGETFDWSGGGGGGGVSEEVIVENEEVTAGAICDLGSRVAIIEELLRNEYISKDKLDQVKSIINGQIDDIEQTTSGALVDLNARQETLQRELLQRIKTIDFEKSYNEMLIGIHDNEEVISYAFAIVNQQIIELKNRIRQLELR